MTPSADSEPARARLLGEVVGHPLCRAQALDVPGVHEFVAGDVDDLGEPGRGGAFTIVGQVRRRPPGDDGGGFVFDAVPGLEVGEEVEEMVMRDRKPTEDGHLGFGEFPVGLHEGGLVVVAAAPDVHMEGVPPDFVSPCHRSSGGAAIQGLSIGSWVLQADR